MVVTLEAYYSIMFPATAYVLLHLYELNLSYLAYIKFVLNANIVAKS